MKAVGYCDYGPADVVVLGTIEKPVPADGELLIRVRAASVNPLDWHFMRGTPYLARLSMGLRKPKNPRLGVDFSGTVEAVGRSVTRFKAGDEVFGSHLWNVEPVKRPSPRWDEGLASFLEDLVTQEVTGTAVVDARAEKLLEWLRGQLPTHGTWRTVPLFDSGRASLTDLSYSVGTTYFALVYRLAGRDAFNRIIGGFAAEFGARGGSTKDLAGLGRRIAPIDLGPLNNDWLFTTAWADRVTQHPSINDLEAYCRRQARRRPSRRSTSRDVGSGNPGMAST